MRQDVADAWHNASRYHTELREIWRYFAPFRSPTSERSPQTGQRSEGDRRVDVYDGTAMSAQANFVANMKADWLPAFEDFFTLDNGPLMPKATDEQKAAAKQRRQELQVIQEVAHGLLLPARLKSDELFTELFAGTGAMIIDRGDRRSPLRAMNVPISEIALDVGPWGDVERWVWKRQYRIRHLEQLWPDGNFSDRLNTMMRDNRNAMCGVTQYTYWDEREQRFEFRAWCDLDELHDISTKFYKTSPWITPRQFVVPGESMGRGFAHLGLPFVKTLNKARELALHAAAFALLGLWTRRNDKVFNPKTAVMKPGRMWKVGSNGGTLGPTLQRLDVPHNFDISSIVIKDERENLRRVLLDDELPEMADAVRSPTEIAGRMRRYDRNRGGATTRLATELIVPMVQRALDVMHDMGEIADITVDQLLTEVQITAPAAAGQKAGRVERVVSFLQIVTGLLGPDASKLHTVINELIPQIGRDMGVDERHLRAVTDVEQLQQIISEKVQEALEQQKQSDTAPPPPQAAPEAPYMNGGL